MFSIIFKSILSSFGLVNEKMQSSQLKLPHLASLVTIFVIIVLTISELDIVRSKVIIFNKQFKLLLIQLVPSTCCQLVETNTHQVKFFHLSKPTLNTVNTVSTQHTISQKTFHAFVLFEFFMLSLPPICCFYIYMLFIHP